MTRLDQAGGVARENVVLHAHAARKVINSINTVSNSIDDFHAPLAIESHREALTSTRWRDAVRDPQQLRHAAAEAGPKVVLGVVGIGTLAVRLRKNGDSMGSSGGDA